MVTVKVYTGFWWENLRERDHLGDPGVDGRIMLSKIFRKWDVGVWTGLIGLGIGTVLHGVSKKVFSLLFPHVQPLAFSTTPVL